jgi:hypothetical protein
LLAGWRVTLRERASWNKQNAPCFVKAATSGAVMYLTCSRSMLENFAGRSTSGLDVLTPLGTLLIGAV